MVAATMGATNPAMKKNIVIFIPIALFAVAILFIFDRQLWLATQVLLPPDYHFFAKLVTVWGVYLFYSIFVAIFVCSLAKKNRKLIAFCMAYLKTQFVFSFAVVRILKILLGRARPSHGTDFIFFSLNSSYNSFPSGHSADAFVSGVFLFYLLKKSKYTNYRLLPLIFSFLIAVSRVFVSAHYPSDVAAGIAIGIMGAWFFISRLKEPAP